MSIVVTGPGEIEITFPTNPDHAVIVHTEPPRVLGMTARYVTHDGQRTMIGDGGGA